MANFDPSTGLLDPEADTITKMPKKNFAPRFGIARWTPFGNSRTVNAFRLTVYLYAMLNSSWRNKCRQYKATGQFDYEASRMRPGGVLLSGYAIVLRRDHFERDAPQNYRGVWLPGAVENSIFSRRWARSSI